MPRFQRRWLKIGALFDVPSDPLDYIRELLAVLEQCWGPKPRPKHRAWKKGIEMYLSQYAELVEKDLLISTPEEVILELRDGIQCYVPPFAQDGIIDGKFGVYPDHHEITEWTWRFADLSEAPLRFPSGKKFHGNISLVNDHGNLTVGYLYANRTFHEYWSVV